MRNVLILALTCVMFCALTSCGNSDSSASTETPVMMQEAETVKELETVNTEVDKAMTELDEKSKDADAAIDDLDHLFDDEGAK